MGKLAYLGEFLFGRNSIGPMLLLSVAGLLLVLLLVAIGDGRPGPACRSNGSPNGSPAIGHVLWGD